ncbi:hypothetical protein KKH56_04490 [bacterium]|nr:hypothetical protein [bacterium]
MPSSVLTQIEKTINYLSRKEQLRLIEYLAYHLREGSMKKDTSKQSNFRDRLVAMASDPEIKTELQQIEREFAITETDGLE